MLLRANRINLKKHAQALLGNEYSEEKAKELIKVCLTGFERTYGHISHDWAAHLEKVDKILGTHGVEGIREHGQEIEYCNTGESYALTVMYHNGKLKLGDWGSIVEKYS